MNALKECVEGQVNGRTGESQLAGKQGHGHTRDGGDQTSPRSLAPSIFYTQRIERKAQPALLATGLKRKARRK